MVYQSAKLKLKSIRLVAKNDINEIRICQNINETNKSLFTAIVVKNHDVVRRFLEIYEKAEHTAEDTLVECFAQDGAHIIVFPYVHERPIMQFYRGSTMPLQDCEDVCTNTIIAAMAGQLPWPILYLILTQRQLNLAKDNSVYLSYMIDLSELDETIREEDCVVECARILLELLEPKASQKATSYILLDKKISKKSYRRFTELYKDVQIASAPKTKVAARTRLKAWYLRNKDNLFRILLVISVLLLIFTVVSLISQAIFGNVPWLRLFIKNFETIGTESLLQ